VDVVFNEDTNSPTFEYVGWDYINHTMESNLGMHWLPGHNISKRRKLLHQNPQPADTTKKAELLELYAEQKVSQQSPAKSTNSPRTPKTPKTPKTPNISGSRQSPRQSSSLNQGYFKTPPPPQSPRPKAVQKLTFNTTQKGKK
jgi:hypothetical protein